MFGQVIDTIYERGDFKGSMSRKHFLQFQLLSLVDFTMLAKVAGFNSYHFTTFIYSSSQRKNRPYQYNLSVKVRETTFPS